MIQIPAWTYEPLTDEEVRAYWSTLSESERIEEIKKLDALEHMVQSWLGIQYVAILDKKGALVVFPSEYIQFPYYDVEIPTYRFENFLPEEKGKWGNYLIAGGVGLVGGVILTIVFLKNI
ncbi:MAG: hypothetical protein ACFFC1_03655 [Promethearchaeota archaeon]